jgi:hypothetical protein
MKTQQRKLEGKNFQHFLSSNSRQHGKKHLLLEGGRRESGLRLEFPNQVHNNETSVSKVLMTPEMS